MSPKKSFAPLFAVALVFLLIHAYYYFPFVADDSFISFRYVDRFLEGKGLTWTDGKPVEGYSNLLWVLVIAFFKKITGGELWLIALCVSLACTVISLWLLLKVTARITDYNKTALTWAAALFVLSAPIAIWINGGLEAPLVMVLLIAGIERLIMLPASGGKTIMAGTWLGLLALTRPDGILFTWAISLGLIFFYSIEDTAAGNATKKSLAGKLISILFGHIKPLLLLNIIAILFYVAQLAYRLNYYGEWVPNTALVKIGFTKTRVIKGSVYVGRMLLVYIPFLLLALVVTKRAASKYRASLAWLATVILIPSLYLALIGGDIFPGYRHVLPMIPLLCIFSSIVVMLARERWFNRPFTYIGVTAVVLIIVFAIQFKDYHNKDGKIERWEWDAMAMGETIGKGFIQSQPSIATTAAGALPYYAKLPALDMLGLNDYYLPRHPPKSFGTGFLGHELGDAGYYMQQSPDIFFFYGLGSAAPYFAAETVLFHDTAFNKQYQKVKLSYKLDYRLPFASWDPGFPCSVQLDKTCYMYVKKNSNKIGIRSPGNNQLIVPAYFFKNKALPDSAATTYLNQNAEMVVAINPGETYIIDQSIIPKTTDLLPAYTFSPVAFSMHSLQISNSGDHIVVYNAGKNKVDLKEVNIKW